MGDHMSAENPKDEISDSTDWLNTPLEPFTPVDAALRCQVCKEFYKTPMITSCSHTFCSLCIRRCLATDGKCPACRALEQEIKLRNNWVVEEIVDAFARARPDALKYARRPLTASNSRAPKRKAPNNLAVDEQLPTKRTRSSSRNLTVNISTSSFDEESAGEGDDYDPEVDDGLVACPICQARMKEDRINAHLDNACLPTEPPRIVKSSHIKPQTIIQPYTTLTKSLPAINYSLLKDNALRKKLSDQGLSAGGPRQLLERRYTEWITLWNANCDSSRPRSRRDLLKELEAWERTIGSNTLSSGNATSLGNKIKSKDFDGAEWQATHEDDFKDLIAKAKAQRKPANSPRKSIGDTAPIPERPRLSISPTSITPSQSRDSTIGTKSHYFATEGGLREARKGVSDAELAMNQETMCSSEQHQNIPPSSQPTNPSH